MTNPTPIFSNRSSHTGQNHQNAGLLPPSRIDDVSCPSTEKGILAGMALESLCTAAPVNEPIQDFSQVPLSELIQYIIHTHHDFIREEMPRLHALCERMIVTRKLQSPELIDLSRKLRRLSGDLTFHISHTENKVFPYIEALERGSRAGAPIAPLFAIPAESLIEEVIVGHAPVGEMLRQIEIDTGGFTPREDACPDIIVLYEGLKELARKRSIHMQLEGCVLFPRALAMEREALEA